MAAKESETWGATVVVSQRVSSGQESEYREWQAEISAAAAGFEGFGGTEVLQPVPGVQEDWVVVYRFDDAEHLSDWLRSDARRELLERAAPFLEKVREHVVATARGSAAPVTVVVSEEVLPGQEAAYERWQEGVTEAARRFPGFLDSELFRPVPGVQDHWVVVFRFASAKTLEAWLASPERRVWLDKAEPLVRSVALQRVGGGLGGWFPTASPARNTPPEWKQAAAVLFGLYPTVMLLTMFLWPRLESLPMAANMFLNNLASVALLAWVVMPLTNRGLGRWLLATDRRTNRWGVVLVVTSYLAMVGIFVALTR